MIHIVDYGAGNLRSVQKAFERMRIEAKPTNNPDEILSSKKLVLPGVGNFATAIKRIKDTGIFESLNIAVSEKKIPILGICLGMQLMTKHSEEGDAEGFGWIDAETMRFEFDNNRLKIPHMGWNSLEISDKSALYDGISNEDLFYFVHSYYVKSNDSNNILAKTKYGIEFTSSFSKENIFGCQFHPEKSHDSGMQILKNFTKL